MKRGKKRQRGRGFWYKEREKKNLEKSFACEQCPWVYTWLL